jgi:hypothetical protein
MRQRRCDVPDVVPKFVARLRMAARTTALQQLAAFVHSRPDAVNRAAFGKERVVLTRRGRKLAGIASVEDIEILEALEERKDIEDAKKALKETAKRGTISPEKLRKELGL